MKPIRKPARDERAQVLPIMALLVVVFIGLLGLAIDTGRLFIARTEMSRALDAAALAGVVELPDVNAAQVKATSYLAENLPDATATFPQAQQSFQLRVQGTRTVDMLFMGIFGFGEVDIDVTAAAGFGSVPIDTVLAIDATGSMGASPCNGSQSNPGCPIKEAKDAASNFTDLLLDASGSPDTQVGIVPYRGCYNPPRSYSNCIPASWVDDLSADEATVLARIADISAEGGSGTNVCLGLLTANDVLFGPNAHTEANTLHFIVILSDGDNTYNNNSYGNGAPPMDCRPTTSPSNSDGNVSSSCSSAQTRERQLDTKTRDLAAEVEGLGVEIYIVGFGVCGSSSSQLPTSSYCSSIGNTDHDNTADRRLLKCIASSTGGTNDHYFEVPTADDLPAVFGQIAAAIAFRLIE